MADLDAELLALAGDASSDEEDAPMNISGASSMSPDGKHGDSSAKPGKKSGGRKGRRSDENDSEEEGEASSGPRSPDSLQSAPMDESDSDSDTSPANMFEDADKYPLEGKFMNATDKADIMALPEIKREEILAERAHEAERYRQNITLRQLLNARESENKKQDKKRKAGATDLDDNHRKTSRQRTKVGGGKFGESSSGIDNLKRARAEKDDRQRRRREDNERTRERRNLGLDEYSDVDADGESELEWDEDNKKGRSPSADFQDAQPAGFQEVERIRVGRSRFAEVCFYPGFDEAITGCYTRISVGKDQATGQNVYRMAVIRGFIEGKPYAMEKTPGGRTFVTNQYIRAAHGKTEKTWPFIMCSDSSFTEAEWSRFQKVCQGEGVPIPTKPKLNSKAEDVTALINRSWTEAELQEKLIRSGALNNKQLPLHRQRIKNEIKEATIANDLDKVEELKAELEKLEGPKLAFNTSLASAPKKGAIQPGMNHKAQQERIAILNLENRRKNIEEVRQAQIKERRAAKRTEAALARGEMVAEDHSKRLKTRAKFKHDVSEDPLKKKETGASDTNSPAVGTPKTAAKVPLTTTQGYADKKGVPGLRRPLQDDDIIGSIDLGIELEL